MECDFLTATFYAIATQLNMTGVAYCNAAVVYAGTDYCIIDEADVLMQESDTSIRSVDDYCDA